MARISIYGATGYTGQLVAAEALRRGVDVVLLGRDKDALAKIPGAKETKAVGLDDISSLAAAFEGSNVVLSCVAPFSQLGSAVLEAAIQGKAHYVDISGDVNWVKRVHDEFGPKAKAAGVILLPAMTDDGATGDLIARLLMARLPNIERLQMHHAFFNLTELSRGSLYAFADFVKAGPLYWEGGAWHRGTNSPAGSVTYPGNDGTHNVWFVPGPEVIGIQRHISAQHISATVNMDTEPVFASLTGDVIQTLPLGPTVEVRSQGRFVLVADGTSAEGDKARVHVSGRDPYKVTAEVSVEVAVRLATLGTTHSGAVALSEVFDAEELLNAFDLEWGFDA
ncbi:unnamed protein product [Clonostachys byssicola]|uniref:Saccharopine dehydrogenase NADP binding domain-containing protein n=1 Tax=Clonostachys byssicola TaxID=160290 RepID=A0A9N9URP5_9HYPO|nr:unnamed protein product [Clonostachys byssicola]